MVAQVSLFTGVEGDSFNEARAALEELNKGKRGHYNKIPKPKHTDNNWEYLRCLHKQLSNFLDVPYFFDRDEVFLFSKGRIKAWIYVYNDEPYEYEGNEYEGEAFKVREAEIVGAENFDIETRLQLHQELINDLENGVTLDKAVDNIQEKIQKHKQRIGDFAQWLKRHRG
jgi:hypothetical protein